MLRGTKTWGTSAPVADLLTVAAKTSDERGMKNIALFLLDRAAMRGIAYSGTRLAPLASRPKCTRPVL